MLWHENNGPKKIIGSLNYNKIYILWVMYVHILEILWDSPIYLKTFKKYVLF